MFRRLVNQVLGNKADVRKTEILRQHDQDLRTVETGLIEKEYRVSDYLDRRPENPDLLLTSLGIAANNYIEGFDKELEPALSETLKRYYQSVVLVGSVVHETAGYQTIISIDIWNDPALPPAEFSLRRAKKIINDDVALNYTTERIYVKSLR